jgi:hypothetical protein
MKRHYEHFAIYRCPYALQGQKYGASDVRCAGETFTWFAGVLYIVGVSGEGEGVDAEGLECGVFFLDMNLMACRCLDLFGVSHHGCVFITHTMDTSGLN